MSALALITGRLQGKPNTRLTKTGGQVTFFTLRVANGSASEYWNVATFSDAVREELTGLAEGAALACSGPFHAELSEWNGAPRLRLKLTADSVLVLKAKPKAPKPGRDKPSGGGAPSGRDAAGSSSAHPGGPLDDDLPF